MFSVSGHRKGVIPVPIPNTEVKPFHGVTSTALWAEKCTAANTKLFTYFKLLKKFNQKFFGITFLLALIL